MGGLNIEDSQVAAKARKLAKLRGKTITAAVSEALDESLKTTRHKTASDRGGLERKSQQILKRIRAKVPSNSPVWKKLEDMYDENGLPK